MALYVYRNFPEGKKILLSHSLTGVQLFVHYCSPFSQQEGCKPDFMALYVYRKFPEGIQNVVLIFNRRQMLTSLQRG